MSGSRFDAVMVLSHYLREDGHSLTLRGRDRMDRGIEYIAKDRANVLIVNAGRIQEKDTLSQAAAMRAYALVQGVPEHRIICDERPLDTAGQAGITGSLLRAKGIEYLAVVSDDQHIRVPTVFSQFFGARNIVFDPSQTRFEPPETYENIREREVRGFETHWRTFGDAPCGDFRKSLVALFTRHDWYGAVLSDKNEERGRKNLDEIDPRDGQALERWLLTENGIWTPPGPGALSAYRSRFPDT